MSVLSSGKGYQRVRNCPYCDQESGTKRYPTVSTEIRKAGPNHTELSGYRSIPNCQYRAQEKGTRTYATVNKEARKRTPHTNTAIPVVIQVPGDAIILSCEYSSQCEHTSTSVLPQVRTAFEEKDSQLLLKPT
eukprot:1546792-Rhodomonas_salina.1